MVPRQQELKIEKIVTWMSGKLALLVGKKGPGQQELEINNMVSWMAGIFSLLVWKQETWAARVGNREDGVLDGR